MAAEKLGFQDFIGTVEGDASEFITELHRLLTEGGCKIEVKEAKSGYVVSYRYDKKTIMNYVFRKKGMIARIYGNHVIDYMAFLDTLPDGMVKAIQDAPYCKRLLNPNDCNPKCAMGNDFILRGQREQKCRYSAFMFLLCEENNPFIKSFIMHELEASSRTK